MAISAAQETVTTSPAKLCVIPPGPCMVVISNPAATAIYVGTGPGTVSTSNGVPVPAGKSVPLTFGRGSSATVLQAVGTVSSAVGVLISQPGSLPAPPSALTAGQQGSSEPGLAVPGEMVPGSPGR